MCINMGHLKVSIFERFKITQTPYISVVNEYIYVNGSKQKVIVKTQFKIHIKVIPIFIYLFIYLFIHQSTSAIRISI